MLIGNRYDLWGVILTMMMNTDINKALQIEMKNQEKKIKEI